MFNCQFLQLFKKFASIIQQTKSQCKPYLEFRWNNILVSRWSKARVLAKRGLNQVYNTIPKSQKWWIINCVINVIWVVFARFCTCKGENCEITASNFVNDGLHAWPCKKSKTWMTSYIFKKFPSLFNLEIPSGIFQIIC
jgi:hypothetical protein